MTLMVGRRSLRVGCTYKMNYGGRDLALTTFGGLRLLPGRRALERQMLPSVFLDPLDSYPKGGT